MEQEQFYKDFIALQSEIPTMPKDKSGYGYKYTDLDTIISNLKPLLKKHNIGFMQFLKTENGDTGIETVIIHASGCSYSAFVKLPSVTLAKTNNAQNEGAAITYFKRYALSAVFGISCDEDIDCSDQIKERNLKQDKAKVEVKNAATSKTTTASLSEVSPTNNTQKVLKIESVKADVTPMLFTPEQANELASIMMSKDAKGRFIFSDKDKEHYREMLKSGLFTEAKKEATEEAKRRTLSISVPDGAFPQDNTETPDALL